jgi:hypothetical protein
MPNMPGTRTLTAQQVADSGSAAGMSGQHLKIMVAIAHAESGFNPRAHNARPPDNSYGLWQINMLGSMGPARRKQFGISSNDQLFDPVTNARAAQSIYKSQGYKAWSVYNSGSYKKFLSDSFQPGTGSTSQTETGPAGEDPNVTAAHQQSLDFFGLRQTFHTFIETARKAAILWIVVLLALVLLILGIILINKDKAIKLAKFAASVKP